MRIIFVNNFSEVKKFYGEQSSAFIALGLNHVTTCRRGKKAESKVFPLYTHCAIKTYGSCIGKVPYFLDISNRCR
jgi:hypothetical protein